MEVNSPKKINTKTDILKNVVQPIIKNGYRYY